ncbi:PREDICTED: probable 28S rRNA (cytosine-C(5))-methyltransferase [Nicrophorus vespilloides]|uniref:Probable 28S rRNA (Cytosine-C(5))-methyltransferase n=1 Tax=Nicrophorus vespilloides TaxID=110193 RepID=A0ABM1MZ61_NICVS|nr:PREDICTED: probable 28S rRNA (cytosine-C(5))-methyltransferase [Nicrophorus vespilloides]
MLEHSIKVPRSYKAAARILKTSKLDGKGVKNVLYDLGSKEKNLKMIYALVMETMKRFELIDRMMKESELLEKEPRFDPWLARILITELVWRKQSLPGESKPIQTVLAYEQKLRAACADDAEPEIEDVAEVEIPRYVRVNTLKVSTQEAIGNFCDDGWSLVYHEDKSDYRGFLERIGNLEEYEFMVDLHLEDVLIFPPRTEFFRHAGYRDNLIILQDKASCLPVKLLEAPKGSTVLDMCAAPGNKTTQIAATIGDEGVIYAVERSMERKVTLDKIVESSGATCVKTICKDVLNIKGEDVPGVEYILVDPSCSGSGIRSHVNGGEEVGGNVALAARLRKLANFQILILKHAMRAFPLARRVVYSTCSIYPEENEEVVQDVIRSNPNFRLVNAGDLLPASWINFGTGPVGEKCIYCRPNIDRTSGFFVAVFEKVQEGEVNEFFKPREPTANANDPNSNSGDKRRNRRRFLNGTVELPPENVDQIQKNTNEEQESNTNKKRKIEHVENETEFGTNVALSKKDKKKKKKNTGNENNCDTVDANEIEDVNDVEIGEDTASKKEKKNKDKNSVEETDVSKAKISDDKLSKKEKKKRKRLAENEKDEDFKQTEEDVTISEDKMSKKEKKKRKLQTEQSETDFSKSTKDSEVEDSSCVQTNDDKLSKKERKKKKKMELQNINDSVVEADITNVQIDEEKLSKKKKKKSTKNVEEVVDEQTEQNASKKDKSKKKSK